MGFKNRNKVERERIINDGYGFMEGGIIRFKKNGYRLIKELNIMDYRSKFFIEKNDESVNEKSKKKIREIMNFKRSIDIKILELEYYNRELNKELDRINK